jgi:hypothetical protein
VNSARAAALAIAMAAIACGQGSSAPESGSALEGAGSLLDCTTLTGGLPAAGNGSTGTGNGRGSVGWLKGTTHVHTCHSGDSKTLVEEVLAWYRDHDYDFIVVTDHNRVTEIESRGKPLVLRGIELTHNPGKCDPAPPEPDGKCRIHLNGVALTRAVQGAERADPRERPPAIEWKNTTSKARVDMYQAGIDKVRELGGLVQINHPNWHWGVDGALLTELARRGAVLVEIANMGFARWNAGDATHPSSEAVWDAALSEGLLIYGVASDDAHDYKPAEIQAKRAVGRPVYPAGTGWVMVRAARRPDAIRAALARGDFYSTTGVMLDRVELADASLRVDVGRDSPGAHEIVFIGQGGVELARVRGRGGRFALAKAPPGYVRAVVTREDGARAWVQPVRVPAPVQPR